MRTPRSVLARCKSLIGERVRLTRDVTTKGGKVYAAGSLWRVSNTWRGRFDLVGITIRGRDQMKNGCIAKYIRGIDHYSFVRELPPWCGNPSHSHEPHIDNGDCYEKRSVK
jgi:hypothetical protein